MQIDLQPGSGSGSFEEIGGHAWTMLSEMAGRECFGSHAPRSWRPRINLYETHDRFVVCVELAGMTPQQIELEPEGNALKIRGDRPKPTIPGQTGDVSVHLMEIDSGSFSRNIPLPSEADVDRISAVYRQGCLWVFLPRASQASGSAGE